MPPGERRCRLWRGVNFAAKGSTGSLLQVRSGCRWTPYPVFVVEGKGRKVFIDDLGGTVVGRQAWPEEESRDLPVAFIPHRKTCQVIRDMFGETGKR